MGNHTTARIGTYVYVILKNRTQFSDKLLEMRSRYYVFEKAGKVKREDVKSMGIKRGE